MQNIHLIIQYYIAWWTMLWFLLAVWSHKLWLESEVAAHLQIRCFTEIHDGVITTSLFMSKKKIMKCSYCALDFLYVMTHSLTIHPSAQLSHSTVNTGFTLHYAMWSKMLIQSYNWSVNGREQAWRKTSEHSRMYTTPHDWADNTSLSTELHLTLQAGQAPSLLTWYHD